MDELYGLLLLPGPGVLCWQAYEWLKDGYWTPLPVSKMFLYFDWPFPVITQWRGVQKILDWLLDIPLSAAVFVLCIAVMVLIAMLQAEYEALYKPTPR